MTSKLFILFLILSFIGISINYNCTNNSVETRNDCFIYSESNFYCCFNSSQNTCSLINKNEINSHPELDCGISEDNYGKYEFGEYHPYQPFNLGFQTCGKPKPENVKDCAEYSEISNSCCFFDMDNQKACLSIGRKVDTEKIKKKISYKLLNGTEVKYECYSSNIIIRLFLILCLSFSYI